MNNETIKQEMMEGIYALIEAIIPHLMEHEPRLLTAEDFENNPDMDPQGYLPCWVECGEREIAEAVAAGLIEPGEDIDGWTAASAADMPGGKHYNPNVRY